MKKYKVLLLGSGAREHALAWSLSKSYLLDVLYVAPGNAGISRIAECINLDITNFAEIASFCEKNLIDLVVSGPEQPLVEGAYDYLNQRGIRVLGPSKMAAKLEGSKYFTKQICKKYAVPTAKFEYFADKSAAKQYVRSCSLPLVIKQDSLAAGKGVLVLRNHSAEADKFIDDIFAKNGGALVEEYLEGKELSFFALVDGKNAVEFGTARDFKAVGEGNTGPNTGGMGAYSSMDLVDDQMRSAIMQSVIWPTIRGMRELGQEFKGILYAGLMLTEDGFKLLEFNVRFGDPELQSLAVRLKSDLLELILAILDERLDKCDLSFSDKSSACVVMASKGYPGAYKKGSIIRGLGAAEAIDGVNIFHGATALQEGNFVASGGRVLSITATGDNLSDACTKAYQAAGLIDWPDGFYRRDIAEG
ncbi:phosphoribosylamine--glycine ligase [Rickettsiales bacterium]|nr:phosphoribosylamine--glycine ligase [Rickettsiales bacterium]